MSTGLSGSRIEGPEQVWRSASWCKTFLFAQVRIVLVVLVAHIGNSWPTSYPRNQNADPLMFWSACAACIAAAFATVVVKAERPGRNGQPPARRLILLCREQTEEWKGWMQWAFIFYHYYRARYVYNEIRVFVSSYVWMTGFGNFLYFDRKKDFSLTRVVSMLVRINWFPLALCLFLNVSIELYYVVPLHTMGFLMTWLTCYVQQVIETNESLLVFMESRISSKTPTTGSRASSSSSKYITVYSVSRLLGVLVSLVVHVFVYESGLHNLIFFWSKELAWRFAADKYSALQGLVCGIFMNHVQQMLQYVEETHAPVCEDAQENENSPREETQATSGSTDARKLNRNADHENLLSESSFSPRRFSQRFLQRCAQGSGILLMVLWYFIWGYNEQKLEYNATHPYILGIPIVGYVLLRNSTYFLTIRYSWFLESLGRNTLETYVLQFHVFMCRDVQHILCILPGSHMSENNFLMRVANMLLCGVAFVLLAGEARKATVDTQDCFIELCNGMLSQISYNTGTQKASEVLKKGGFGSSHAENAETNPSCEISRENHGQFGANHVENQAMEVNNWDSCGVQLKPVGKMQDLEPLNAPVENS